MSETSQPDPATEPLPGDPDPAPATGPAAAAADPITVVPVSPAATPPRATPPHAASPPYGYPPIRSSYAPGRQWWLPALVGLLVGLMLGGLIGVGATTFFSHHGRGDGRGNVHRFGPPGGRYGYGPAPRFNVPPGVPPHRFGPPGQPGAPAPTATG